MRYTLQTPELIEDKETGLMKRTSKMIVTFPKSVDFNEISTRYDKYRNAQILEDANGRILINWLNCMSGRNPNPGELSLIDIDEWFVWIQSHYDYYVRSEPGYSDFLQALTNEELSYLRKYPKLRFMNAPTSSADGGFFVSKAIPSITHEDFRKKWLDLASDKIAIYELWKNTEGKLIARFGILGDM